MKRSQLEEENCGHWEYEVQCPIAPPEAVTLDQSLTPRGFDTTTRRLRFLRESSTEDNAELAVEGRVIRGHETSDISIRSRADFPALGFAEQRLNRRASAIEVGAIENPNGSLENNGHVVGAVLDTTGNPMLEVYEEKDVGTIASTPSLVDEFSQTISSNSLPQLVSGEDTNEPEQDHYLLGDRGKENQDPLGGWGITPRRSPLPVWFPREPLQDITNVLTSDLNDEQPQTKKRKKKVGTTLATMLITRSETSAKKTHPANQPKPFSYAASSQASNLRKNFR